jgi:sugar lactone lactonase YvrE
MNPNGFGQLPGSAGCIVEEGADAASGSPASCGSGQGLAGAESVVISPDGKNLYTGSHVLANGISTHGAVAFFNRSSTDGTLSEIGCASSDRTDGTDGTAGACAAAPAMNGVNGLAVSPDGNNVYAVSSLGNSISTFRRDPATGTLAQTSCLQSPAPDGKCRPASSLLGADSVAVSPDGKFVYVAASYANAVDVLQRDPSTGALSELSCVSNDSSSGACAYGRAMRGPTSVAISPDGKFVYLGSTASHAVDEFSRDPQTGALTQIGCLMQSAPSGGSCTGARLLEWLGSIVLSPDGSDLYVAASLATNSSPAITYLRRDATSGLLSEVGCVDYLQPPGTSGDGSSSTDNSSSGDNSATTSSAMTGSRRTRASQNAPTDPCTSVPGIASVTRMALSPDGTKLFAVGFDNVSIFTRDPASGGLTLNACVSTDDTRCGTVTGLNGPSAAVTSIDGANLYVVSGGNALTAYGPAVAMPTTRAALHRDGSATIAVACPAAARARCAGVLRLALRPAAGRRGSRRRQSRRASSASVAAGRFRALPGHTALVKVPLPGALRSLARRPGGVTLLAATTSTVRATGNSSRVMVVSIMRGRH